jgi:CRISPR-associated exonuclease Cas4
VFPEEELLPLSALQHLVFCERQCALIHIEQVWKDNALTLEGSRLHERTDEQGPRREVRGDVVTLRGLPVRSLQLGVSGRADVVEFRRTTVGPTALGPEVRAECGLSRPQGTHGSALHSGRPGSSPAPGVTLPGLAGCWKAFPVEYKRGKPKKDLSDRIQLCAQAICLEEMLGTEILDGAIFYGRMQRRTEVTIGPDLRGEVEKAARRLHELVASGITPQARRLPKCDRCSLLDLCLPRMTGSGRSARAFFSEALSHSLRAGDDLMKTDRDTPGPVTDDRGGGTLP